MNRLFLFLVVFNLISVIKRGDGQSQTIGTFINEEEALNAFTLFSVTFGVKTYLINNCGEKINEWSHDFRAGLAANLLPDGRLLRSSRISHPVIDQTSQGGLLEIYAWDGDIEWSHDFTTADRTQHHEIIAMPNGNILLLAWAYLSRSEVEALGRDTITYSVRPLYTEAVYEIMPLYNNAAEIIWEWHLKDHYVQDFDSLRLNYVKDVAEHPGKYNFNYSGISKWSDVDWTHCNALDYNPERDEILINCRGGNEFWIIDHSTTSEEAATDTGGIHGAGGDFIYRWGNPNAYGRGTINDIKLYGAHGLEWIQEGGRFVGSIIAFNNGTERPGTNYSTIEVILPQIDSNGHYILHPTQSIFWPDTAVYTFTHDPPEEFTSNFQSNAVFLPNGNLFTNRGDNGHFTEFDSTGNVVWDYINPAGFLGPTNQGQTPSSSSVFTATRLPVDHPAFEGKDLTPQGVIELNSNFNDCELFTAVAPIDLSGLPSLTIQYNTDRNLLIQSKLHLPITVELFTMQGQRISIFKSPVGHINAPLDPLSTGIYLLHVIVDKKSFSELIYAHE